MGVPNAAAGLAVGLFLLAAAAAACGDDPPEVSQPQQQAQAAAAQAEETQSQPIDAAEQPESEQGAQQESSEAGNADSAPQATQPEQSETAQGTAPESDDGQQVLSDPDREILIEGERYASSIASSATERQFRFQAATGAWLRILRRRQGWHGSHCHAAAARRNRDRYQ